MCEFSLASQCILSFLEVRASVLILVRSESIETHRERKQDISNNDQTSEKQRLSGLNIVQAFRVS